MAIGFVGSGIGLVIFVVGPLTFVFGAAQLLGPQMAGIVADRADSFAPAFVAASALSLGGAVCA